MAVTLEWVRDNYDTNKDRYIDNVELIKATDDYFDDKITLEELNVVIAANEKQTLLPAYTTPPPTGVTLEWIRDHYDTITRDRYIDAQENLKAIDDYFDNKITLDEQAAVQAVHNAQTQLPAYPSPPINGGIDPVTTPAVRSLEAGKYNIIVTKSGYNTVYAKITVDSSGNVSCDSVTGGTCGGTGYPRVEAPGTTSSVKVYMAATAVVSDACSWITSIGGWRNLQWTSHVLEAYYVYIGATGHSVGFSPVTWNDVLALYYYYIGDLSSAESKSGCGFT